MKRTLLATVAALALSVAAASADCAADLAQMGHGSGEGISKDGSLAPLQSAGEGTPQTGGDAAGGGTETGEGEVAKDGSAAPLEADAQVATSGQDAQAQQAGGDTAAAQAAGSGGSGHGDDMQAALDRAQAALDAGDEAGCMAALEEARGL